jgi:hypothetical protein
LRLVQSSQSCGRQDAHIPGRPEDLGQRHKGANRNGQERFFEKGQEALQLEILEKSPFRPRHSEELARRLGCLPVAWPQARIRVVRLIWSGVGASRWNPRISRFQGADPVGWLLASTLLPHQLRQQKSARGGAEARPPVGASLLGAASAVNRVVHLSRPVPLPCQVLRRVATADDEDLRTFPPPNSAVRLLDNVLPPSSAGWCLRGPARIRPAGGKNLREGGISPTEEDFPPPLATAKSVSALFAPPSCGKRLPGLAGEMHLEK